MTSACCDTQNNTAPHYSLATLAEAAANCHEGDNANGGGLVFASQTKLHVRLTAQGAGTDAGAAIPICSREPTKQDGHSATRSCRVHRRISSSTCLRVMYVTGSMAERLLADLQEATQDADGFALGSEKLGKSTPVAKGCNTRTTIGRRPVFTTNIEVEDSHKRRWPIRFMTQVAAGQYHRRLSTGWTNYCAANGVRVGDTVEFRRMPGRRIALRVNVLRPAR